MRRRTFRMGFIVGAMALALIAPSAVFADGEIGDMGDTDSITDVFVSGGRPAVNIDYVKDCPNNPAITDCWIEVQFVSRCPESWCGWSGQPYFRIPASGAARGKCLGSGNEDNEWYINYRTGYTSTVVTTNRWKGEVELVWDITGGFVYRLIAEALFNVNAGVGYSGGTTVETVTTRQDYSPPVRAASSGGRDLVTC